MPLALKYDFSQESLIHESLLERMQGAASMREEISFSQLMSQTSPHAEPPGGKPSARIEPEKKKGDPTL